MLRRELQEVIFKGLCESTFKGTGYLSPLKYPVPIEFKYLIMAQLSAVSPE